MPPSDEKNLRTSEASPSASDEVMTMVHAFSDEGRKSAVRELSRRVERIEVERNKLRVEVERLRRERATGGGGRDCRHGEPEEIYCAMCDEAVVAEVTERLRMGKASPSPEEYEALLGIAAAVAQARRSDRPAYPIGIRPWGEIVRAHAAFTGELRTEGARLACPEGCDCDGCEAMRFDRRAVESGCGAEPPCGSCSDCERAAAPNACDPSEKL